MPESLALTVCAAICFVASLVLAAAPRAMNLQRRADSVSLGFALMFFLFTIAFAVMAILYLIPEPTPWH